MYPADVPTKRKNRMLLWIAVSFGVLAVVVVIVATLALGGVKQAAEQNDQTAEEAPVATNDQVKQSMAVLDAAVKQADTDRAAAKAALNDDNAVKVSD